MTDDKLKKAFEAFDQYNTKDPNIEMVDGASWPKELLYAVRMTDHLNRFAPHAPEYVQLAARCQHIGRWEIPRSDYPMDRKGYLMWRNTLKQRHAGIAERILRECGYDNSTIELVQFLLLKKQLHTNPDTQLLEDIICLVFIEHYLEDFAGKHEDSKVVDILRKTLNKMSSRAIQEAEELVKAGKTKLLLKQAAS